MDLYDMDIVLVPPKQKETEEEAEQESVQVEDETVYETDQVCLYLSALEWWTTDEELLDRLEDIQIVGEIEFDEEKSGKSRGRALIEFVSKEDCMKAARKLNGTYQWQFVDRRDVKQYLDGWKLLQRVSPEPAKHRQSPTRSPFRDKRTRDRSLSRDRPSRRSPSRDRRSRSRSRDRRSPSRDRSRDRRRDHRYKRRR
ncbi:hypothetical protein EDD86DRAFT_200640 [Gorgonomyces haynaldii]|nr:hypothetical protein EDD86DRAFT_200640 [Gorgonomyces haynaldii]